MPSPSLRFSHFTAAVVSEALPDFDRYLRRLVTRSEHSFERIGETFREAGFLWLWFVASTSVFLTVVVLTSVADVRMFDLRHHGLRQTATDVAQGARVFFRVFRDPRTPHLARAVLVAGLCYWLSPIDLIPDTPMVPGFVDDLAVAVSATWGFFYLCPDAVVARHASSVQAEAGAQSNEKPFIS